LTKIMINYWKPYENIRKKSNSWSLLVVCNNVELKFIYVYINISVDHKMCKCKIM
jgi:hypothetical protein